MSQKAKLLAAMKANSRGDWSIADVQSVCAMHGINCRAPSRGSHFTLSHPDIAGHLTVPSRRPIKAVYIRLLIDMVESLEGL
ncbi:MAG: type II toxin-antitoxin system HicA family toxin [Sphingomonas bacterium]|nr:type II toxin-antitoxin system HicA family toxin [Sphingomonas bacterium]